MISKKIISFILVFVISFSTLIVPYAYSATSTTTISSTDVDKTIAHAETLVGTYYKGGYCLNFVVDTWTTALGGYWKTGACCATAARKDYRKSQSRTNIPKGASVFFTRNKGECGKCKSHPGHVGIYVGQEPNPESGVLEDKIVHCYTNGKIKKSSINEIINDGYTYSGWGYPSGKKIETLPETPENSTLSITVEKLPTTITQGNSFGLHGKIESNFPIISITGSIYDNKSQETILSYTDTTINTNSLNISTSILNTKLKFGDLPVGDYTLRLIAEDSTTKVKTLPQNFTVKAPKLSVDITCNLDKTNNIHTAGKSLGLYGTISSSYNISAIRGYVINSKGTVELSSQDFPSSKTVNINTCNLNKSLKFGDLGPGVYTLKIEVLDASGTKITKTRKFEVVKNKDTNIVTGTVVNLNKLGWKTVSIRTGASTNYKIIGDMTTGAKCTVNLSKSTTNWYYIEYNGIKGYASKKGISI